MIQNNEYIDIDVRQLPRLVYRKYWNDIVNFASDLEKVKRTLFYYRKDLMDIYREMPEKFDSWLINQMQLIIDKIYEYVWEK